jgi:hypothetical protein
MSANGSNQTQLTFSNDRDSVNHHPVWSPDDEWIAYMNFVRSGFGVAVEGDVMLVPAAGGNSVNITNTPHLSEAVHDWRDMPDTPIEFAIRHAHLLPTTWYSDWASDPRGTIRAYLGGLPEGYDMADITTASIHLNDSIAIYGGRYRILPSHPAFEEGPVMEMAFSRQAAVQSLGDAAEAGDYTVSITGEFTDGNRFIAEMVITLDGGIAKLGSEDEEDPQAVNLPTEYRLGDAYPNPFNPSTTIEFDLPNPGQVTLEVYNIAGQKVQTIVDRPMNAGTHSVQWHGTDESGSPVASGIYLYRLTSGDYTENKKMILMK